MLEEQSFRIVLAEQALDDRLHPPAPQPRHVTLIYEDLSMPSIDCETTVL
jgi:hypothetical protein